MYISGKWRGKKTLSIHVHYTKMLIFFKKIPCLLRSRDCILLTVVELPHASAFSRK